MPRQETEKKFLKQNDVYSKLICEPAPKTIYNPPAVVVEEDPIDLNVDPDSIYGPVSSRPFLLEAAIIEILEEVEHNWELYKTTGQLRYKILINHVFSEEYVKFSRENGSVDNLITQLKWFRDTAHTHYGEVVWQLRNRVLNRNSRHLNKTIFNLY